jgi:hypothetical protein
MINTGYRHALGKIKTVAEVISYLYLIVFSVTRGVFKLASPFFPASPSYVKWEDKYVCFFTE